MDTIYRYKFTDGFMKEIKKFIDIHRFDESIVFKEAWVKWYDDHSTVVDAESTFLKEKGYGGDIASKMYKSVRYYYKNKPLSSKKPKKRQKYIRIDTEILEIMDRFIDDNKEKPSASYEKFIRTNGALLNKNEDNLIQNGLSKEDIALKMKKTFKNRYFRLVKK